MRLPIRPVVGLALLGFAVLTALAACKPPESPYEAKRKAAAKEASVALGGGKGGADLDLRWVVKNQVNGEDITCAYSATPALDGGRPKLTPIIIRAGKTIQPADVGTEAFSKLQDQLCGPDWVKPAQ